MAAKCLKAVKKDKVYEMNMGIDTLIERLKKMRALNCNPYDIGLDGYVWKNLYCNTRTHSITKVF
jgi:hypothetical protein